MKIECTPREWGILQGLFLHAEPISDSTVYNFPDFRCTLFALGEIRLKIEGKFKEEEEKNGM